MTVQSLKDAAVDALGLSRDALHIYVGLLVFLGVALLLRKPLRSWTPWLAAVGVAALGEVVDARDDGRWQAGGSLHDFLNTVAWPTILLLLARFTRLFGDKGPLP